VTSSWLINILPHLEPNKTGHAPCSVLFFGVPTNLYWLWNLDCYYVETSRGFNFWY